MKVYPVKVINNGIDLKVFKTVSSSFRTDYQIVDKFIILGVANIWNTSKGLDFFIELSKQLEKEQIIVLVGVTEKQKEKLPSNIIGIRRTNNIKELAEIYTEADVFLNSNLEEVFGLVNAEALACGTPVITFRTGGSVESVDESTGYIVEVEDSEKIKDIINAMQRKLEMKDRKLCRDRAKCLYDKEERYRDYLKI